MTEQEWHALRRGDLIMNPAYGTGTVFQVIRVADNRDGVRILHLIAFRQEGLYHNWHKFNGPEVILEGVPVQPPVQPQPQRASDMPDACELCHGNRVTSGGEICPRCEGEGAEPKNIQERCITVRIFYPPRRPGSLPMYMLQIERPLTHEQVITALEQSIAVLRGGDQQLVKQKPTRLN